MVSFKDYNLELIRDFTEEQFISHIQLMEDIQKENDFDEFGISTILENYLKLVHKIHQEHQQGIEEFRFTKNEVLLYDLNVEIARLCYKHSLNTSVTNDWEDEFN